MNSDARWSRPDTVRGFVETPPNQTLLQFAADIIARGAGGRRAIDIGCGAARNAIPLAAAGWDVYGVDTSTPMLAAAAARARALDHGGLHVAQASMLDLPFPDRVFDLVIAHGIWNLATHDDGLRRAMGEAARVSKAGAALFVFTFSRNTLRADAQPLGGELYVYDQFSGEPQVFMTSGQLIDELHAAGYDPDPSVPLTELNRPAGKVLSATGPVIYQGAFRRRV